MEKTLEGVCIPSHRVAPSSLTGLKAGVSNPSQILDELARGALRASRISDVQLARTVSLCASNTIPLTNAAMAVQQLVIELTHALCHEQHWPGARSLLV